MRLCFQSQIRMRRLKGMRMVFKRFRRDFAIVILLTLTLFLALALISYSPFDPSFSSTGHGTKIRNLCGIVGSFMADFFLQILGLCSWLVVGFFSWLGFTALKNGPSADELRNRVPWVFSTAIFVCALLGLHFPELKLFNNQISAGGALGLSVAGLTASALNHVGAAVVLWACLIISSIGLTHVSLETIQEHFQNPIQKIFSAIRFGFQQFRASLKELFRRKKTLTVAQVMQAAPITTQPKFILREHDVNEFYDKAEEAKLPIKPVPSTAAKDLPRDLQIDEIVRAQVKSTPKQRIIENWELPKLSYLSDPPASRIKVDEREIRATTSMLEDKLAQFSIGGQVTAVRPGPAVTMFEFKPNADVRIARITELADDLALALSSESVRIIAPVPGRDVVGIETSNSQREKVYLKDNLTDPAFWDDKIKLPVVLGKQANGAPKVVDLRKMPHLLVAGTTGSGKSVFVVSVLTSLLFRHSPKTLRLILVDPKQVDLASFQKIPHLLLPLVTDPRKAVNALKWGINEMEKRYRSMSKFGVRGLEDFNQHVSSLSRTEKEDYEKENVEMEGLPGARSYYFSPQPYIVIVVEEFADLMAVDKLNVEQSVVRLAQMARACGIHLLLAMQSPRRDVVTGLIKTNIPGRISFKVASKVDSRIILDESGAERLLANGDMLFHAPGVSRPERHHGAWVSEDEIDRITKFWSDQAEPAFDELAIRVIEESSEAAGGYEGGEDMSPESEERYDEILDYVSQHQEVSASLLQRKFRLGYPRAARMIEIFEKEGVVGPANGSKPRQVLIFRAP